MSQPVSGAKTDPELVRQMSNTAAGEQPIEAVVRLRPDDPSQIVPHPERTEELTREILDRVKNRVGSSEYRYNVFKNLGSFVVSAPPAFLRELISQPEVAAAAANRQPESALIPPVKVAPDPTTLPQKASRSSKKAKARASAGRKASARKSGK